MADVTSTPTAADLYTSGAYLADNPDWHAGEAGWKARAVVGMLNKHDLHPISVVDIGCGTGDVLARVQTQLAPDANLAGYDIAPKAIELAAGKANERLSFEIGMPDPNARFDLMLLLDVIEHVEDADGWLRDLRRTAEHTIIHLPLDISIHRIIRPGTLADLRRRYGHLHFYNREMALTAVAAAGFEVLDWAYTEEFKEGRSEIFRTRMLALPRHVAYGISPDWSVRLIGGCRLLILAK